MKQRIRPCPICRGPAAHGRILCADCDATWERSPEHARAACALTDFVNRARAERVPSKSPKLTSTAIQSWGRTAPIVGGYRPPEPKEG